MILFQIVGYGLAILSLYALVDATRRPAAAYVAHSKQTKPIWTAILVGALLADLVFPLLSVLGILTLAGVVGTIVYLVDVKPAISGSNNNSW